MVRTSKDVVSWRKTYDVPPMTVFDAMQLLLFVVESRFQVVRVVPAASIIR